MSYHMTICGCQVSSLVYASTAVMKVIPCEQVMSSIEKNTFVDGKEK